MTSSSSSLLSESLDMSPEMGWLLTLSLTFRPSDVVQVTFLDQELPTRLAGVMSLVGSNRSSCIADTKVWHC